jgi:hypothetical protein
MSKTATFGKDLKFLRDFKFTFADDEKRPARESSSQLYLDTLLSGDRPAEPLLLLQIPY